MMHLLAIDTSGIGKIQKLNPEKLDDVVLHEILHKLESDHIRDVVPELNSKRCDAREYNITDIITSLL